MTTFEIPFSFTAYGRHGKRVPRKLRVVDTFRHAAEERSLREVEGTIRIRRPHQSLDGVVIDGELLFPILVDLEVGGGDGGRPATADDLHDLLRRMARDEESLGWAFENEPFLDHVDLRQGDDPQAVADGSVVHALPDDRERKLAEALRRASHFKLVDGMPYTSRYEPCVGMDGRKASYLCEHDVTKPMRDSEFGQRARLLSLPCLRAVDAPALEGTVEGDLDAVRWRLPDAQFLLAQAAHSLAAIVHPETKGRAMPVRPRLAARIFAGMSLLVDDLRDGADADIAAAEAEVRSALALVGEHCVEDDRNRLLADWASNDLALLDIRNRAWLMPPASDLDAIAALSTEGPSP